MGWLKSPPPWLKLATQVVVLAALAILLIRTVDWAEAWALLTSANPLLLLAAAALLTLQTFLSAIRWRITAARLGISMPLAQTIREYYLSQVVNQSLPGGVLGDAGRAFRARQQAGLLASSQAVLFERLAGQIGLLCVFATALALNALNPSGLNWPWGLQLAIWITTAVLALCILFTATLKRTDTAFTRGLAAFRHAVFAAPVLMPQAALNLGTALCNIAAFALCAAAVGAALPPLIAAALLPMVLFAMVLPLSISGWGLREGAAAVLFPLAGLSASAGLASSVAFGLVFLAITLPGLLMLKHVPDLAAKSPSGAEP